jgi:hypothetical protein
MSEGCAPQTRRDGDPPRGGIYRPILTKIIRSTITSSDSRMAKVRMPDVANGKKKGTRIRILRALLIPVACFLDQPLGLIPQALGLRPYAFYAQPDVVPQLAHL